MNGFKRFMPLKTHRVKLQVYEDCFKRDEGQKWLIEFIEQTGLLRPITMDKAGTLIDKFVQLDIIEEVTYIQRPIKCSNVRFKNS